MPDDMGYGQRALMDPALLGGPPMGPWGQQQRIIQAPPVQRAQAKAPPAQLPAGAGKALAGPPMPGGPTPEGAATQADLAAMMDEAAKRFTPPPSPMEQWARNAPPPMVVVRGSDIPGQIVPGAVTATHLAAGGPGGARSVQTTQQAPPMWVGRTYETPWGPTPQRPDADMMAYERQLAGLGAAQGVLKDFPAVYQGRTAMADALMRLQAEMSPMRTVRDIAAASAAESLKSGAPYADVGRAYQGAVQGLANNIPAFMMPGQGGAGPAQPPAQAPVVPQAAVLDFLAKQGVLNEAGVAPGGQLDLEKLGAALAGNQTFAADAAIPQVVAQLRKAGVPEDQVDRAMREFLGKSFTKLHYFPRGEAEQFGPVRVSRPETPAGTTGRGPFLMEGQGGTPTNFTPNYAGTPFDPTVPMWPPAAVGAGAQEQTRARAAAIAKLLQGWGQRAPQP